MTELDASDLGVCDHAELAERLSRPLARMSAAVEVYASRVTCSLDSPADDAQPGAATIGDVTALDDAEYERAAARTTIERLSAHASMARGGWPMSDTTEGATA